MEVIRGRGGGGVGEGGEGVNRLEDGRETGPEDGTREWQGRGKGGERDREAARQ